MKRNPPVALWVTETCVNLDLNCHTRREYIRIGALLGCSNALPLPRYCWNRTREKPLRDLSFDCALGCSRSAQPAQFTHFIKNSLKYTRFLHDV